MESCLYQGYVRHRRFHPIEHQFSYTLFMMYLDLTELPTLFKGRWLWSSDHCTIAQFRRSDHLGDPGTPLDRAVRDLIEQRTQHRPRGPIRLLTHLRYFGHCFNPVSFYYCYDDHGQQIDTIVAEVNNTPWGEQHCYVLDETLNEGRTQKKRYRFDKTFHVSPFMDMEVEYDWRFLTPGAQLITHMTNRKAGHSFFDATMRLSRQPISTATLTRALVRYPFMTTKVLSAIYFQALRLRLKNAPFYEHPNAQPTPGKTSRL